MPSNLGRHELADWIDWDKGEDKPSQEEPSDEVLTKLQDMLSILTDLQREVYIMRVASQMSFSSIGLILNKSAQNCRAQFTLADEKIRLKLRKS